MIKSLIRRLIGKTEASSRPSLGKRQCVPVSIHHIDPNLVDDRALQVVQTLQDRGYQAYIVGGAVRDLALGRPLRDLDLVLAPKFTSQGALTDISDRVKAAGLSDFNPSFANQGVWDGKTLFCASVIRQTAAMFWCNARSKVRCSCPITPR